MAGESPDKSEQRKSSGETAPGERDPRLAVFRQASPGASAPGVDQPTAVFKMPPAEAEAAEPPTVAREPGTESGSVEGDARLRAAVAAWVATADDEESGGEPEPEPEPDAERGAAGAEGTGDAADDVTREEPAGEPEVEEPSAAAEGDAGGDAEGDAPDDVAAGGPEPDAATTPDEDEPAVEEPSAEAPVHAASVEDPAGEAPAEDPADEDLADEAVDEAVTASDDVPDGKHGDEAGAVADTAEEASSEASEPSDKPPTDEPADKPAASEPSGEPAVEEPSADAEAGSEPVADEAPADALADKPEAPDAAPADKPEAPDTAPESAKANDAVDQPTTMFKALRPPVVDHPTTALKLPPAATPPQQPKPESDVERTSTFVPLRADGVRTPTPRKPEPEASAPVKPGAAPGAEPATGSLGEAEQTRQQPMPPLPPLDLLAELTNTPPPPETPVRTVVRRFKIWTPFAILLLIVFAVVQTLRPLPEPTLAVSGEPTFTFKGGKLSLPWPNEGQGAAEVEGVGSLGTYGAQKPAPIASVAKTMTAYVILKGHPITGDEVGPKITVDKQAGEEAKLKDESRVPINEGEQYTERQMLQMLMIPSGNNAARLLARWDAKSEAEFVKKMNDAAKDLGMTNSTYTDPSGLKATTVSTPKDQLKLANAVMQNDVFREIVNTPQATIPGLEAPLNNNNDRALLLDGVGGIKTGSSTPAGGNLLWAANALVDGKVRRMVGITMGVQQADSLNGKLKLSIDHSIKVIQAAQQAVISDIVVKKGDVVGYVDDGLGGRTAVVATKELKAVGWAGLAVEVEIGDGGKALPHSAKAGDVVGQVSVGSGTGKVSAPVALQKDLVEPGFGAKLTRLG